jgi:UDP-N-acetylglucosamine 2-epimerase (non-hydrolysing)
MVQGDTNSAVAGALAAIKLRIPVAHLEAGVRSYDWTMPEEVNRRLVDSIATVCLAPTSRALHNLASEGRGDAAHLVGDTLVEVARPAADQAEVSTVLEELQLRPQGYALMTLHRGENVDSESRLGRILECLEAIDYPLVYPIHPRARKMLDQFGWLERVERRVRLVPPLGYVDFLRLLRSARVVLTDSGGVQQESSILGVPCVTLRYNTEWVETVELGQNQLVGVDPERVVPVVRSIVADEVVRRRMTSSPSPFQPGAARRVVDTLASCRERGWPALLPSDFLRDGLPLGR